MGQRGEVEIDFVFQNVGGLLGGFDVFNQARKELFVIYLNGVDEFIRHFGDKAHHAFHFLAHGNQRQLRRLRKARGKEDELVLFFVFAFGFGNDDVSELGQLVQQRQHEGRVAEVKHRVEGRDVVRQDGG